MKGVSTHSIWSATADLPHFDALPGDTRTDVLIIGGGMAGLLCAHSLHSVGVERLLLEADRIGCGITKNTTDKIAVQHGLHHDKLIREFGTKKTGCTYRQTSRCWRNTAAFAKTSTAILRSTAPPATPFVTGKKSKPSWKRCNESGPRRALPRNCRSPSPSPRRSLWRSRRSFTR